MTLLRHDLGDDGSLRHARPTERRAAPVAENLLLASYQFPPLGGVGVQRALALAKFFPECDYKVHVLTPANGVSHTYDPSLEKEIPAGVMVHRVFTPELPFSARRRIWEFLGGAMGRNAANRPAAAAGAGKARGGPLARLVRQALFPDPQVVWTFGAASKAVEIVRTHRIGTVVVTVPPFSTLRLIPAIKKAMPYTTVVADFRDEWLEYYMREISGDPSLRERAYRMQQKAVAAADLVVAVTESSLRKLRKQHPEQRAGKFAVIANGYDPTKVFPLPVKARTNGAKIKVVYIGTVYKPCSPRTYLAALDRLPEELRSRFETRFVGRVENDESRYLVGCSSKVETLGFLPQNQALRHMEEADYLLLPLTEPSVLPGKVYEYMATGKPVLALTPAMGELGRLIRETGTGLQAEHGDVDAIARLLASIALGTAERVRPDAGKVESYSRLRLAQEYARLIRRKQGIWEDEEELTLHAS